MPSHSQQLSGGFNCMYKGRDKKGRFIKGHQDFAKNKGRKWPEESKKNISKARKGKPTWSSTHKEEMSKIIKKEHQEGKRKIAYQKISIAKKKYWSKFEKKIRRISYHTTDRRYIKWRKTVFERDNYTCWICEEKGGRLNAHHLKSWAKYPKLRYKVLNGLTLCEFCHKTYTKFK